MKNRQQNLLKTIIDEYIKSAQPVASGFLVYKLIEKVSSATIRNEMADLEKDGYIAQPHTSAGRIPTAKAYQFYVDNYIKEKPLNKKIADKLSKMLKQKIDQRDKLKQVAKQIAAESRQAVIVAFAKNDVYYTGLSNLFSQPEFEDKDLIVNLSKVIDHLDKVIFSLFDQVKDVKIKIGSQCPFDQNCSAIVGQYNIDQGQGLIAILGPVRMDYQNNYNLINFVNKI